MSREDGCRSEGGPVHGKRDPLLNSASPFVIETQSENLGGSGVNACSIPTMTCP